MNSLACVLECYPPYRAVHRSASKSRAIFIWQIHKQNKITKSRWVASFLADPAKGLQKSGEMQMLKKIRDTSTAAICRTLKQSKHDAYGAPLDSALIELVSGGFQEIRGTTVDLKQLV